MTALEWVLCWGGVTRTGQSAHNGGMTTARPYTMTMPADLEATVMGAVAHMPNGDVLEFTSVAVANAYVLEAGAGTVYPVVRTSSTGWFGANIIA